ncbi:MAG TPA: hypothetical protein PLY23_08010 [Alphaproteobacteria bacterium]|nr:hypothetical protein [Alphaproteobacteria bacterium]HQS94620.1 hypothetical protein [Alphaproteobacteria bacterium]
MEKDEAVEGGGTKDESFERGDASDAEAREEGAADGPPKECEAKDESLVGDAAEALNVGEDVEEDEEVPIEDGEFGEEDLPSCESEVVFVSVEFEERDNPPPTDNVGTASAIFEFTIRPNEKIKVKTSACPNIFFGYVFI